MQLADILPWLNVLLIPAVAYLASIERRLTRLELQREAEKEAQDLHRRWSHRRATDPDHPE